MKNLHNKKYILCTTLYNDESSLVELLLEFYKGKYYLGSSIFTYAAKAVAEWTFWIFSFVY